MKNNLLPSVLYVVFFGLPIYLLLEVYNLPRNLHIGSVFGILLICIQFGNLESRISKMEDDFYGNK